MATRKTDEPTAKDEAGSAPRTIVLADNDPLILEAIGELLRNKNFTVHPARDGVDALRAVRKVKPDYLILDIIMPKLDGGRVCAMIRHDRALRHTPIIALSALSPDQIRRFPALSADAYVAKGPLTSMANNVLMAIKYVDERGRGDLGGGIFGYETFRARRLIGELLSAQQHWETLIRMFGYGVLELDAEGLILMVNAEASRILGRQESRLITEPFPALFASPERQVVEKLLADLRSNRLPEAARMTARFGGREVAVRLASTVEEGVCVSFLVTLEPGTATAGES